MANQIIKDDEYMFVDDEFEQIRISLGMYISKEGTEGALHLIKEATNNDFDEALNPEALSHHFDVVFDEQEQSFSIVDYSRGIPHDIMVNVCTKKHSSTKMIREDKKMKDQCGRNGVGLVVIAACSSYMSMTSYRGDTEKTIEFINGKLTEYPVKKMKKPRTGLAVKFIPSPKYLKGEIHLEPHMIEDYFRHMSYIMREDITVNLYEFTNEISKKDYEKKKADRTIKYKRQGLAENVKYLSSNLEFPPVEVVSVTEDFDLELSFSYDKTTDEQVVDSYCNYVHTTEGGNHELVAQRAICDFFTREAKKLDPNNKYEVTFDDCKKGLIYCINCKHVDPAYEGQHKTKVSNKDVLSDGKRGLVEALQKYFGNNNALLRRIISYLRTISKIRLEAHKIKGISTKKQTTFMDDAVIAMWHPLARRNHHGYSEIIIAEGDSAVDAVDKVRNNQYQAVLGVQGVVDNTYGMTVAQVLAKSKVFRNFVNLLGCGIGKDFDITKLRYDKIIIMADADTDGSNITSLVLLFIVLYLPELIIQGKVYKALPPLMEIEESYVKKWKRKTPYLFSKDEYYRAIGEIVSDHMEVAIAYPDNEEVVTPLSKKETRKWLVENSEYTSEMVRLMKRARANPTVLEYVIYAKLHTKTEQEFKRMVESHFDEIDYNLQDRVISGSYQQEDVILILDDVFWEMAKRMIPLIERNESLFLYVKNRSNAHDTYDLYTIWEFLSMTDSVYNIKLHDRFKGLGESGGKALFSTTLNPKVRKLIRFTMDDKDRVLSVFNLLHAKSTNARQQRRDLLENSTISYMDLDN